MQNLENFKKARVALLGDFVKNSTGPITETKISFNNDVPRFLERIARFQRRSIQIKIIAKTSQ